MPRHPVATPRPAASASMRKLFAGIAATALALTGCKGQPSAQDDRSAAYVSREPLKHGSSIHDPRPLESVTGVLRFLDGCWVVSSGPNWIALFFPKETRLANGELHVGTRRLREGQSYKFVGDLAETGVDTQETCNGLASSMSVGDAWPPPDQL